MAIVRTTPRETNNTGAAPPSGEKTGEKNGKVSAGSVTASAERSVDRTRSVVRQPVARQPAARPQGGRPGGVARPGAPSRPGGRAVAPARAGVPVRSTGGKDFINDTMTELRRVVWPTKEAVRSGTIVTIGLLIFFALYIFVLDVAAEQLFKALGLYSQQ